MVNEVTLIGNVGSNPKSRTTGGTVVADFSLATNRNYKDKDGEWQQDTEWHNIVCWRDLADRVINSVEKGKLVYVKGRLHYNTWEDKDGNKHTTTAIVAETVRVLSAPDGKRAGTTGRDGIPDHGKAAEMSAKSYDDDLPF